MIDSIFSPSFGNKPGTLVGRDMDMKSLTEGLFFPKGNKERARLIIGQRGLGKTVLLLELADFAKKHGYITASPTVVSGDLLDRIIEKLEREISNKSTREKTKITGGTLGLFGFSAGIQTDTKTEPKRSFAYQLLELCEIAEKIGYGILILIDEVQANSEELKKLIIAYQEMVGEGKNIAVVFAGLPTAISKILNEHVLTFFNRASKLFLEPIKISEIVVYYQNCFRKLGIQISDEQIDHAANATNGSPYMMQLIGHYITVSATDDGKLPKASFERALELSRKEFVEDICEATLSPLSEKDIVFLRAMADDKQESSMKDICARLQVDSAYAQRYKTRLIQAGVITQKRRGFVEYAVPYLKEYFS